jgi:hypothetical protein
MSIIAAPLRRVRSRVLHFVSQARRLQRVGAGGT